MFCNNLSFIEQNSFYILTDVNSSFTRTYKIFICLLKYLIQMYNISRATIFKFNPNFLEIYMFILATDTVEYVDLF